MILVCWAFAVVTLASALVAAMASTMRTAALALWITGLSLGGIFLTLGAETLAIIQWILSTLGTISLVFFAVMFGEYTAESLPRERKQVVLSALGTVIGLAFAGVIFLGGAYHAEPASIGNVAGQSPASMELPAEGNDLAAIGRVLTQDHLLSLEVLALTLFMVLVGGGVVARPDLPEPGDPEPPLRAREPGNAKQSEGTV